MPFRWPTVARKPKATIIDANINPLSLHLCEQPTAGIWLVFGDNVTNILTILQQVYTRKKGVLCDQALRILSQTPANSLQPQDYEPPPPRPAPKDPMYLVSGLSDCLTLFKTLMDTWHIPFQLHLRQEQTLKRALNVLGDLDALTEMGADEGQIPEAWQIWRFKASQNMAYYLQQKYPMKCGVISLFKSTRVNKDVEYTPELIDVFKKIETCFNAGETRLVITLTFFQEQTNVGHANTLIIDRAKRIMYKFEPYGHGVLESTDTEVDDLCQKFNKYMTLKRPFKVESVHTACLNFKNKPGLQFIADIQNDDLVTTTNIEQGLCAFWSTFFAECVILNPTMEVPLVYEHVMNVVGKDFLRALHLIRGYVFYLIRHLQQQDPTNELNQTMLEQMRGHYQTEQQKLYKQLHPTQVFGNSPLSPVGTKPVTSPVPIKSPVSIKSPVPAKRPVPVKRPVPAKSVVPVKRHVTHKSYVAAKHPVLQRVALPQTTKHRVTPILTKPPRKTLRQKWSSFKRRTRNTRLFQTLAKTWHTLRSVFKRKQTKQPRP